MEVEDHVNGSSSLGGTSSASVAGAGGQPPEDTLRSSVQLCLLLLSSAFRHLCTPAQDSGEPALLCRAPLPALEGQLLLSAPMLHGLPPPPSLGQALPAGKPQTSPSLPPLAPIH